LKEKALKRQKRQEGVENIFGFSHRDRGSKTLKSINLVVFCSSEEKRVRK
jgi:hypothetical protein